MIYRGSKFSDLFEAYIFCDYVSGHIWALKEVNGAWTPSLLGTEPNIVSMGVDPRNGETLLANIVAGKIERFVRTGTTGTNPPALLSQTGAFSSLTGLTPNDGIVPYTPNVAFWSDYAIKTSLVQYSQPGRHHDFDRDANWTFPTGSIWIKHFELETTRGDPSTRRRLETRFLVKNCGRQFTELPTSGVRIKPTLTSFLKPGWTKSSMSMSTAPRRRKPGITRAGMSAGPVTLPSPDTPSVSIPDSSIVSIPTAPKA